MTLTPREASMRLLSALLPGADPQTVTRVDLVIRPADYPRATFEIMLTDAGQVHALVNVLREIKPELAVHIESTWGQK